MKSMGELILILFFIWVVGCMSIMWIYQNQDIYFKGQYWEKCNEFSCEYLEIDRIDATTVHYHFITDRGHIEKSTSLQSFDLEGWTLTDSLAVSSETN